MLFSCRRAAFLVFFMNIASASAAASAGVGADAPADDVCVDDTCVSMQRQVKLTSATQHNNGPPGPGGDPVTDDVSFDDGLSLMQKKLGLVTNTNRQAGGFEKGIERVVNGAALNHTSLVAVRANRFANGPATYGDAQCRCIGIDNIDGETIVQIGGGETLSMDADVGARCEKWEDGRHPSCLDGATPDWCVQPWCYVDPCDCDIPVLPKTSSYLPDASYQGLTLYYSYATCGGTDSWTGEHHQQACVNQMSEADCKAAGGAGNSEKCAWDGAKCGGAEVMGACNTERTSPLLGTEGCRCIGIANQPGETMVKIGGEMKPYPADTGASCQAWDETRHPACLASEPPGWCAQSWCYVDPCECGLETSPKVSSYLPDAKVEGKRVYYSYATCDSLDMWTEEHHEAACVNQQSEDACGEMEKCAWTGTKCLGREAAGDCMTPE